LQLAHQQSSERLDTAFFTGRRQQKETSLRVLRRDRHKRRTLNGVAAELDIHRPYGSAMSLMVGSQLGNDATFVNPNSPDRYAPYAPVAAAKLTNSRGRAAIQSADSPWKQVLWAKSLCGDRWQHRHRPELSG
jgi:hypothetical protein